MDDSIYKGWEDKLKALKEAYDKELNEIREKKKDLFNLNIDSVNKQANVGRIIRDEHRIVLSAPEIIIGDVNLGGMLNPDGGSTIIIRGNKVGLEAAGNSGQIESRATIIKQTAENPGIDGLDHIVEGNSQVVTQGRSVTIDAANVTPKGSFLTPIMAQIGSVGINADGNVELNAVKSKADFTARVETRLGFVNNDKNALKTTVDSEFAQFEEKRKEIDKLVEASEKFKSNDINAIRKDYRDLNELNLLISDLQMQLSSDLYNFSRHIAQLADLERQSKYFETKKQEIDGINENDFKTNSTRTAITLNSEKIAINSTDGDGILRTNKDAGLKIAANNVMVEGILKDDGLFEDSSVFSVHTKKVELNTAGLSIPEADENGAAKKAQLPADGAVKIISKDIILEAVDHEADEKGFKEKGLAKDGNIQLRSQNIELSNINTSDIKLEEGKVSGVKYTPDPDGKVRIFSQDVSIDSRIKEKNGEELKYTGLPENSMFDIKMDSMTFDASDHEGKNAGTAYINAKDIMLVSAKGDPEKGGFGDPVEGGSAFILAENFQTFASKEINLSSQENIQVSSEKTMLLQAKETAELKQGDKNFISLTGDNADISGSKVTVKGDTTINVLTSPNVTVDNLEAKSCIKAPNISDGMAVGAKNTSAGSGKLKADEQDTNKVQDEKSKLVPKENEKDKAYNPQISVDQPIDFQLNCTIEDDNKK